MRSALKRVLITLPVLWLVITIVFLLIHLVPGDPVVQMLGEGASAADITALRHAYGLDAPLPLQYGRYLGGVARGDLGQSLRLHSPVLALVASRYPVTLALALASLALGILIAVPAGVWSAQRRGRWPDRTLGVISLVGLSFPNFALGPILILLFSIGLGWLPVSGLDSGWGLILPAITLGLGLAAILTRMVRTAMLEELNQDYIRTARAKGLTERRIVYRHALRNALVPVITVIGLQFGSLLAGAIVTETIFSLPGLGRLTLSAISNRDYALVQGCILAIGLTYVAVNLLTDVLYTVANPRLRTSSSSPLKQMTRLVILLAFATTLSCAQDAPAPTPQQPEKHVPKIVPIPVPKGPPIEREPTVNPALAEYPARTLADSRTGVRLQLPAGWVAAQKDGEMSTFHLDARSAPASAQLRLVASLGFNPFPRSTFSGALFYLSAARTSDAACTAQTTAKPDTPIPAAVIDDVKFRRGKDEHGRICTQARDIAYTAMRHGLCLRFDLAVNTFCGGEVSGVKEMSDKELADVFGRMESILQTVTFNKK